MVFTGFSPSLPLKKVKSEGIVLNQSIVDVAKQNLKTVLLTVPGERMMDMNFGVGLKKYLFEQNIGQQNTSLKSKIIQQVNKYLPYIHIQDLVIEQNKDEPNQMMVELIFNIVPISKIDKLQVFVKE